MNKRQAVALLSKEQIQLLERAANIGATLEYFGPGELKKLKKAIKIVAKINAAEGR